MAGIDDDGNAGIDRGVSELLLSVKRACSIVKRLCVPDVTFDGTREVLDGSVEFVAVTEDETAVDQGGYIIWIDADGLGVVRESAIKLSRCAKRIAPIVVSRSKPRSEPDGLIVVGEGTISPCSK